MCVIYKAEDNSLLKWATHLVKQVNYSRIVRIWLQSHWHVYIKVCASTATPSRPSIAVDLVMLDAFFSQPQFNGPFGADTHTPNKTHIKHTELFATGDSECAL